MGGVVVHHQVQLDRVAGIVEDVTVGSLDLFEEPQKLRLEAIMDTVLFTDQSILLFVITTTAIALMLSVLGLATTYQTRSDIKHQLKGAAVRRGSA